ncbi:hypothetical protein WKH57_01265 [Niallia taxi]|uniref:hypothetical protein n=1 Tax=Niallia taxi TaxID=2499688 RepID=UPI00316C9954
MLTYNYEEMKRLETLDLDLSTNSIKVNDVHLFDVGEVQVNYIGDELVAIRFINTKGKEVGMVDVYENNIVEVIGYGIRVK